eukprot:m.34449 g.34449  ORF g.34449 m.34449 type:complete len:98 (-) comp14303_c0_seq3:116-409(-)
MLLQQNIRSAAGGISGVVSVDNACFHSWLTPVWVLGWTQAALAQYKRALDIFKCALPSHHPNLTVAYNNLGDACAANGMDVDAAKYYEMASVHGTDA